MNKFFRILRYDWPLHFVLLFTNWFPDNVVFLRIRGWLVSFFLLSCGRDLRVGRNVNIYNSYKVRIGNNVYIAFGNWLCAGDIIDVGNEVLFGPYSIVVSGNHTRLGKSFRYGPNDLKPIKIGNGVWVGGNCSILGGAIIGDGSLIAANTVVSESIPDDAIFSVAKGNVIKRLQ